LSRWPGLMPPNFSAAYGLVFCAGLYLPGLWGWVIPLGVMLGSDCLISLFFYHGNNFSWTRFLAEQGPNYAAYAGLIGLGRVLGARRRWWVLLGGGIAGAFIFYLVTNTASWLALPYAKTVGGWIQALTTGMPGYPHTWEFFLKTLGSGGLFTGLFVGAMKMTAGEEAREQEGEKEAEEAEPEGESAKAES